MSLRIFDIGNEQIYEIKLEMHFFEFTTNNMAYLQLVFVKYFMWGIFSNILFIKTTITVIDEVVKTIASRDGLCCVFDLTLNTLFHMGV